MPDTTFEEAKRCPKCSVPGETASVVPADTGGKIHILKCVTPGCRWYDSTWVVQVNRDGSIPVRKKGEKELPPLADYQKQRARDSLKHHEELMRRGQIDLP